MTATEGERDGVGDAQAELFRLGNHRRHFRALVLRQVRSGPGGSALSPRRRRLGRVRSGGSPPRCLCLGHACGQGLVADVGGELDAQLVGLGLQRLALCGLLGHRKALPYASHGTTSSSAVPFHSLVSPPAAYSELRILRPALSSAGGTTSSLGMMPSGRP